MAEPVAKSPILRVCFLSEDDFLVEYAVGLRQACLALPPDAPVCAGEHARVKLELPGADPVYLKGFVRPVADTTGGRSGLEVVFSDMPEEASEAIQACAAGIVAPATSAALVPPTGSEEVEAMQAELTGALIRADTAEERGADLELSLADAREDATGLRARIDEMRRRVDELTGWRDEFAERITELESENEDLRLHHAAFDAYKAQLDDPEALRIEGEASLESLRSWAVNMRASRAELVVRYESLAVERQQLVHELETLRADWERHVEDIPEEVDALEARLAVAVTEVEQLRAGHAERGETIERLNLELDELRAGVSSEAEADVDPNDPGLPERLRASERAAALHRARLARAEVRAGAAEEALEQARAEVRRLEALEEELASARRREAFLRKHYRGG